MRTFEYADDIITHREMTISIISMTIGVGILTLPRAVARYTNFSDGWISIMLAGAAASAAALMLAWLTIRMGRDSYYKFAIKAVGKPAALAATAAITVHTLIFAAYEVRSIATISKQYLFTRTPVEVIGLCFLLLVIYAAAGARVGLIRLNVMFLPIVLVVTLVILLLAGNLFHPRELVPAFTTPPAGIMAGAIESVPSLLGFEIVLFYGSMLNRPKDAVRSVLIGVNSVVLLYIFIYIVCVGVFAHEALSQVSYPAIEIAKEARIPGRFFERLESIFFVLWIMTIFNTTAMAVDILAETLRMMLKRKRTPLLLIALAPLIYLVSMLPQTIMQYESFGRIVGITGGLTIVLIPIVILAVARIRGVTSNEQA